MINISNIGTKEWIDFKSDICYGLYYSLLDLNIDVSISFNELKPNTLNIIIGADFLCNNPKFIDQIISKKVPYAIFEVEYFDGQQINFRKNFPARIYIELLNNSKFIFSPYKKNIINYRNITRNIPLFYTPWGFHRGLDANNQYRLPKQFFALFFGLNKGSRQYTTQFLTGRLGTSFKIIGRDDPQNLLGYFISRSKWGLSLSYGPEENFLNPFRIFQMLSFGTPVITDSKPDLDMYTTLCLSVDTPEDIAEAITDCDSADYEYLINNCRDISLTQNLKDVFSQA